eukprot:TRINITY_DN13045_c0_g1_i1.p1 TRINITY_DN13045_c0_g1~~TRINITY_DN13045_c0_g1_i1.p1  ORF type:complete len:135 (-),score=5.81 TRINITY_DN13045_c0_g1_i1:33-437(-)
MLFIFDQVEYVSGLDVMCDSYFHGGLDFSTRQMTKIETATSLIPTNWKSLQWNYSRSYCFLSIVKEYISNVSKQLTGKSQSKSGKGHFPFMCSGCVKLVRSYFILLMTVLNKCITISSTDFNVVVLAIQYVRVD